MRDSVRAAEMAWAAAYPDASSGSHGLFCARFLVPAAASAILTA